MSHQNFEELLSHWTTQYAAAYKNLRIKTEWIDMSL